MPVAYKNHKFSRRLRLVIRKNSNKGYYQHTLTGRDGKYLLNTSAKFDDIMDCMVDAIKQASELDTRMDAVKHKFPNMTTRDLFSILNGKSTEDDYNRKYYSDY